MQWVKDWGYVAVFLGSLVEGESVILTASSMAYFGYLSLYKVMVVAFFGTVIADQALYCVGRRYGHAIFDRFPRLKKSADRAFSLLHRFDVWFIIACRFIYGIRITSAVVIGAAGIPLGRFIPLNILSALIWTVVSCIGGYMLGDFMVDIFNNFHLVQKYLFIAIGLLGAAFTLYWFWRKKYAKIS